MESFENKNGQSPEDQEVINLEKIVADYRRQQIYEALTGPVSSLIFHVCVGVVILLFFNGEAISREAPPVVTVVVEPDVVIDDIEIIEIPEEIPDPIETDRISDQPLENPIEDIDDQPPMTDDQMNDDKVLDVKIFDSAVKITTGGGNKPGGPKGPPGGGFPPDVLDHYVVRALRWFKEHQNPELGCWPESGNENRHGMTGLALLAFFAHNDTPTTGRKEFRGTVIKGLNWLAGEVDLNTGNLRGGNGSGGRTYEHAIVFYALAEAYGMTRSPELLPVVEAMLNSVLMNRAANGGWDYAYKKDRFSDISLSCWFYQGLKACVVSGITNSDMIDAFDQAGKLLRVAIDDKTGRGAYRIDMEMNPTSVNNATYINNTARSLGAACGLCLQLIGDAKSADVAASYRMIQRNFNGQGRSKNYFKWDEFDDIKVLTSHQFPVYDWYYQTQVVFQNAYLATEHMSSKEERNRNPQYKFWKRYLNDFLLKEVAYNQQSTKSLDDPNKVVGWWDYPGAGNVTVKHMKFNNSSWARYYSTALNCLMLEVVSRNLPTMKPITNKVTELENEKGERDEDEIFHVSDDSDADALMDETL